MLSLFPLLFLLMAHSLERSCQFQDNLEFPKDAIVVGVAGIGTRGPVKLGFDFGKPIILILVSHSHVKFLISPKETKIAAIVTYGVNASEIEGAGTLPVIENSEHLGGPCTSKVRYQRPAINDRYADLAFRTWAVVKTKQLTMRLFPHRQLRQYWSPDFQNLQRID
jgi:hypothetical protein